MKKINAILVILISSLTITGISFLDGQIWNIIFRIVGMITYAIVGVLLSIGFLRGRKESIKAYLFVFLLLIIVGFIVYIELNKFKLWIISWPLFVKILVPCIIVALIITMILLIVIRKKKEKNVNG